MHSEATLYMQVVVITNTYLGPAAERFVARQVQNHLHIQPNELSKHDLEKLIDWVRVAVGLLTEDQTVINEYIERLQALAVTSKTQGSKA